MKDIYNLKSFYNKMTLALVIIVVFFCFYQTIPDSEFTNIKRPDNTLDRLMYSVSNMTGIRDYNTIQPLSDRAKVLTTVQTIIGYSILLL